jgi:hypothetical protein
MKKHTSVANLQAAELPRFSRAICGMRQPTVAVRNSEVRRLGKWPRIISSRPLDTTEAQQQHSLTLATKSSLEINIVRGLRLASRVAQHLLPAEKLSNEAFAFRSVTSFVLGLGPGAKSTSALERSV